MGVGARFRAVLFFFILVWFWTLQGSKWLRNASIFDGFAIDLINFWMKMHENSPFGAKRCRNVFRNAPDVKFALFCKALRGRAPNVLF